MKCLLDPSSSTILFFFVALLMISTNTPTCLCNDYDRYKNCNNPFICGNSSISKQLTYPFWWEENREPNCGGIAYMGLTCEESVPKMLVGYLKYRILDWNKTTQMLKVARDDYWGGNICAVTDYKNVTFETTYFQLVGDQSSYVALLYNCDAKGNLPTRFYNMNCGADTTVVYTVGNPSSAPCSRNVTVVIIPIMRTRAATLVNTSLSLTNAIEEGFELKYTGEEFTECGRCVDSGGICGNDRKTGSFRCFCKDGPYTTTTCNSPKPTSSMSPISPEPTSSISPIFEPKKGSKSNRKRKMWLIVTGGSIVGFGIAIFSIVIIIKRGICGQKRIFWKRGKFVDHDVKAFMQSYDLFTVKRYNYTDLKRITNSFRDKVGQGGYGVVYKGCLSDGRLVAVKVISESKGSGEDFINEVASIGRTSHMNIVSLLGFCYEVNKRALIFEFMPNGSLDNFIYRSGFPNAICDFDWNTLFRIAIAIARGLEYLHQGCIARILHLDIKPQNILLDEDFCPKISDFGLAKICQKKESIVSIPGTRGTIGYMAPEVFSRAFGGVSHKSDVYSYGMLILEMIGGRNNHDTGGSHTTEMYFPDWIYKDLERGKTPASCLTISEEENEIVRKITMVSLWCIQTNPSDRPSMKKVIDLLEGPLESVPHPPKPVLYFPEIPALQIPSISSSGLYETNSITT